MRSGRNVAGMMALTIAVMVAPQVHGQVNVPIGDIPAHSSVTIEFDVQVNDPVAPLATTWTVCSNGTVTGSNFSVVDTDDPGTMAATDSTCTALPDYGDAPNSFATLRAANGAVHALGSGIFLGASADADADGQPTAGAAGDDSDGNNDDDGVVFTSTLIPGATTNLNVTASLACILNAWLDFNTDGDWNDAGEQVFTDQPLAAGVNSLSFLVPGTATMADTFARFRCSTDTGLSWTGLASDGEVEDYGILIVPVELQYFTVE